MNIKNAWLALIGRLPAERGGVDSPDVTEVDLYEVVPKSFALISLLSTAGLGSLYQRFRTFADAFAAIPANDAAYLSVSIRKAYRVGPRYFADELTLSTKPKAKIKGRRRG